MTARPIEIRRVSDGLVLSRHQTVQTAKRPWRGAQLSAPATKLVLVDSRGEIELDAWPPWDRIATRSAPTVDALDPAPTQRLGALPGYELLAAVLDEALQQAQGGKGIERHAGGGEAFEDQQIVQLGAWMGGSTAFAIGQACKKALESTRLPDDRARAELLGAINYLAAAVIVIQRRNGGGK